MVRAAALILIGFCGADPELLRKAVQPRWTAAADAPPIEFSYRRDTGRLIFGGARLAIPVAPAATLFMQARKQKDEVQTGPADAAAPSRSRAYSVGLSLRW